MDDDGCRLDLGFCLATNYRRDSPCSNDHRRENESEYFCHLLDLIRAGEGGHVGVARRLRTRWSTVACVKPLFDDRFECYDR